MPTSGPMVDRFGRISRDLRISLTDRCNLRCTYCMPAEGLPWLPHDSVLTTAEISRLIRISVERLGIEEIRFTGGEPLLRPDLVEIVRMATALTPRPEVSMTTNALSLARFAPILARAGLDRVNVSLDAVNPSHFASITRRDRSADALAGLRAAAEAGLTPVKVNAVLDPVTGLDDAVDLAKFCLAHGYELRIIEQMPLDADHVWSRESMITSDAVLERLSSVFDLTPSDEERGSAPAERFIVAPNEFNAAESTIGIISAVSRPFCGACDRTRLTADGQVRNCLFSGEEFDLRDELRSGATDEGLALRWREATWAKLPGHGINEPGFLQPSRPMSAIGG